MSSAVFGNLSFLRQCSLLNFGKDALAADTLDTVTSVLPVLFLEFEHGPSFESVAEHVAFCFPFKF